MFCHSAAEGVAVGVAHDQHCTAKLGFFITTVLAIHNIPEGLAVSLVLVPKGMPAPLAALASIMTSVPQPFLAVIAFHFVEAFTCLLPIGLSFAAGAMIYVGVVDLLFEALETLPKRACYGSVLISFGAMMMLQSWLNYVM